MNLLLLLLLLLLPFLATQFAQQLRVEPALMTIDDTCHDNPAVVSVKDMRAIPEYSCVGNDGIMHT
jgi:hypothetical protein